MELLVVLATIAVGAYLEYRRQYPRRRSRVVGATETKKRVVDSPPLPPESLTSAATVPHNGLTPSDWGRAPSKQKRRSKKRRRKSKRRQLEERLRIERERKADQENYSQRKRGKQQWAERLKEQGRWWDYSVTPQVAESSQPPVYATAIVYVMTNESMPGVVKIGRTTGSASARADSLRSTGVPSPFHVHYAAYVNNAPRVEKMMHDKFNRHRVDDSREFFRINADTVSEALRSHATGDATNS